MCACRSSRTIVYEVVSDHGNGKVIYSSRKRPLADDVSNRPENAGSIVRVKGA